MATHSMFLPGESQGWGSLVGSMGSQRVGHDWSDLAAAATAYMCPNHPECPSTSLPTLSLWVVPEHQFWVPCFMIYFTKHNVQDRPHCWKWQNFILITEKYTTSLFSIHVMLLLTSQVVLGIKNLPANMRCKRLWFNPLLGKIPWRRAWQSTPVSMPGESHEQRTLVGYSPWGLKEMDTIEST